MLPELEFHVFSIWFALTLSTASGLEPHHGPSMQAESQNESIRITGREVQNWERFHFRWTPSDSFNLTAWFTYGYHKYGPRDFKPCPKLISKTECVIDNPRELTSPNKVFFIKVNGSNPFTGNNISIQEKDIDVEKIIRPDIVRDVRVFRSVGGKSSSKALYVSFKSPKPDRPMSYSVKTLCDNGQGWINQIQPIDPWNDVRASVSQHLPDIPNGTNCSVLVRALPYKGGIWSSEAEIRFDPSAGIYETTETVGDSKANRQKIGAGFKIINRQTFTIESATSENSEVNLLGFNHVGLQTAIVPDKENIGRSESDTSNYTSLAVTVAVSALILATAMLLLLCKFNKEKCRMHWFEINIVTPPLKKLQMPANDSGHSTAHHETIPGKGTKYFDIVRNHQQIAFNIPNYGESSEKKNVSSSMNANKLGAQSGSCNSMNIPNHTHVDDVNDTSCSVSAMKTENSSNSERNKPESDDASTSDGYRSVSIENIIDDVNATYDDVDGSGSDYARSKFLEQPFALLNEDPAVEIDDIYHNNELPQP